jgi:hypothetical protein
VSTFAPGLDRYRQSGGKATRAPYASGAAGHAQSLDLVCEKIREGRLDPAIRSWSIAALRAAGIDGRDHPSVQEQAQALLDALRATVIYVADPTSSELIAGAATTLCLRQGLCLNGSDCDDLVVALGSALLSIGLAVSVVKEDYSGGLQSHVMLAVRDERGQWLYVDPSTKYPVSAQSMSPLDTRRVWLDPLEDAPVEIVGVGRHPFGAPSPAPSPALIGANWVDVADHSLHAGLRYAAAIVVNPDWADSDVRKALADVIYIEAADRRVDFPSLNAWVVVGLARRSTILSDTKDMAVSAVLLEQPPPVTPGPVPAPPTNPDPATVPQLPSTPAGVGIGTVLFGTLGVIAAGGVGFALYEHSKKRRRLRA